MLIILFNKFHLVARYPFSFTPFIYLCFFLVLNVPVHAAEDVEFRDKLLLLGSGPVGGSFGPIGDALCESVNSKRRENLVRCVPVYSAGSVFNIYAVTNGSLQLGLAQEDLVARVYRDSSDARGSQLRTISLVHNSPIGIMVRRASGIKELSDIRNGVINIGNKGAGYYANAKAILKAMDLEEKDFKGVTYLAPTFFVQAFCEGRIDIIVNALAHPSDQYRRLRECGGEFLSIPSEISGRMMSANSWLRPMVIPAGMYDGSQSEVLTLGVRNILFSNSKVDPQAIFRLYGVIASQFEILQVNEPLLASMKMLDLPGTSTLAVPMHEGSLMWINRRMP